MSPVIDVLAMVVVVAGIMVMVRPGSQGPSLIQSAGAAFTGMLTAATGSGIPPGWSRIT